MVDSSKLQRKLELVVETGLLLTRTLDLQSIVQSASDAGLQLCGAQFGAFFYNVVNAEGESRRLYALSGVGCEKFANFPMPRNTLVFGPTFEGMATVRSGDITKDPRYGRNSPYHGIPEGHLPVRSYLAIPVRAQNGDVLGGLFYGHEQAYVFDQNSENLVAMVAAQAAIAIENTKLREQLTIKVIDLQKAEMRHKEAAKGLGELAAIVESSDDAIVGKDLNGIITSWNSAATRILGYSSEEMIGTSILRLIPKELHPDERTILAKIQNGERIGHFETVRLTKKGERLDVSLTISPVRDDSGKIVGASKILRDISMRKEMEKSILQSEKIAATGRMAATIAHEINNPLEAVVNLLFLAQQTATDPTQIEYLNAAESEVARVSHLAKQTLGYYREHASAVKASLCDLAANAVKVYQRKCETLGIRIETQLQSSRLVVMHKGEMMQVISNLIANAIYAMPSGGVLSIAVNDAQDGVMLSITDTGVGIPAEVMPRIFEAFFTTGNTIGTGIGLFVARKFVEGHGGKIDVQSSIEPESHGTKISIFLPLQSPYSRT
ncbi:MAG: PAS domain S-box protein [Silvibacterium sp.]